MRYFAYGSNMKKEQMLDRRMNFSNRISASLLGYKLVFNKVSGDNSRVGYANVVECEDSIVEGILYEIKNNDLCFLDRFEGYPNHYIRRKINVQLSDETITDAIVYIAHENKTSNLVKPTKEYLDRLLCGQKYFSVEYFKKLKNTKVL